MRKGTIYIDHMKMCKAILRTGKTARELSVAAYYCPQWLTQCIHRGTITDEGAEQLEKLGIMREDYEL